MVKRLNVPLITLLRPALTNPRTIIGISRLSPKNQVTIPKDVRERFSLKTGDRLIFSEEDGKLVLSKG